jgi:hypothetical protein
MIDLRGNNKLHARIAKLLKAGKRVVSGCMGRVGEITDIDDLFATIKPKRAGKNGKTRYACQFMPGKDVLRYVKDYGWTVKDSRARLRMAFGG